LSEMGEQLTCSFVSRHVLWTSTTSCSIERTGQKEAFSSGDECCEAMSNNVLNTWQKWRLIQVSWKQSRTSKGLGAPHTSKTSTCERIHFRFIVFPDGPSY
jgi:hypothetical protein